MADARRGRVLKRRISGWALNLIMWPVIVVVEIVGGLVLLDVMFTGGQITPQVIWILWTD